MLRICFYGGPGVGKSTLAALVYAELNQVGVRAELVQEFIKLWAYEGRQPDAYDQVYTFANQLWAEHRLARAGVRVVVTDSPVLLQCVYTAKLNQEFARHLRTIAMIFEAAHTSLNFFVKRTVAFNPHGRFQTDAEVARKFDERIMDYLNTVGVHFLEVTPEERESIIQTVKSRLFRRDLMEG